MIPFFVMLAATLAARGVGGIGWQPLDDWQVATLSYHQEGTMYYSGIDQHKRDCMITTRSHTTEK